MANEMKPNTTRRAISGPIGRTLVTSVSSTMTFSITGVRATTTCPNTEAATAKKMRPLWIARNGPSRFNQPPGGGAGTRTGRTLAARDAPVDSSLIAWPATTPGRRGAAQ